MPAHLLDGLAASVRGTCKLQAEASQSQTGACVASLQGEPIGWCIPTMWTPQGNGCLPARRDGDIGDVVHCAVHSS
jgi:hypothetical protein